MKYADIVFELIGARLPLPPRNPTLGQIAQQKFRLISLDKTDPADPQQTKLWREYFRKQGHPTLVITARESRGTEELVLATKETLREKRTGDTVREVKPHTIRAVVLGIPNVRRSTSMNRLIDRRTTQTGSKPGVTRDQQWFRLDNELELLDTLGILWPEPEDGEIGKKLALTDAIRGQLIHLDDLTICGLDLFAQYYPGKINDHCGLPIKQEEKLVPGLLTDITVRRGYKEGYDHDSELVVCDIRRGGLGRYTLGHYEEMGQKGND